MTPLERMVKANYEEENGIGSWDLVSAQSQNKLCGYMRAALLALVEMELNEETIDAALMSIGEEEVRFVPIGDARKAPIYFRAILRSLIEEAGTADTDLSTRS